MKRPCQCSEGILDGDRLAPQVHDCAYVAMRNALIPAAERIAADLTDRDRKSGALGSLEDVTSGIIDRRFGVHFNATMERLVRWR